MNKKGLTLVELLAVIAIIAVISIMIIPGIFSIREGVLDSSYENKVSQIVNAAKNYGQEHITELKSPVTNPVESTDVLTTGSEDCIYRTINFLINNGYLKVSNSYTKEGEENTDFTDPRTNEAMNSRIVCIRFDNNNAMTREVIAYLIEE